MPTINNRFENLTLERLQEIYDIVSIPVSTGLTVGVTTITGGTVGRVLFQGAGDVLQESSNLFWDNVNIRLGIGVTPTRTLHVQHIGTTGVTGSLVFYNQNNSYSGLSVLSNGVGFSLNAHTNGTGYISATSSLNFTSYNGTNPAVLWMGNGSRFRFTNTAETSTYLLIANSGNVLVNTVTDAGFRFEVSGTARTGDLTIGTLGSSNVISFGGGVNNTIFRDVGEGSLNFRTTFSNSINFRFRTNSDLPNANTSGTNIFMSLPIGFAPTSGTGTWTQLSLTPTINQTGGANGITRGIYINPTLTSAADFRAIESSIGRILFTHNNAGNIQADYSVMIKGNNPRLRIEGGTAGTTLADAVIQFADSAGDNWIIKTNRSNGNLVFGLGWNNSITNIVTFGTSTIQPALGVTGVSSSTGTALSVQNSALSSLLTVLNTGNVLIGTATNAGYKLDVNGTSAFRGIVRIFGEQQLRQEGVTQTFTSSLGIFRFQAWSTSTLTAYINGWNYEGYLNFAVNIGTSSTAVASAVLEVTSTTRGFLPPRMTTAQKTAIATPAVGLVVYDTTTNKLCCYNGTSWNDLF